jgi:hypothetical protein
MRGEKERKIKAKEIRKEGGTAVEKKERKKWK